MFYSFVASNVLVFPSLYFIIGFFFPPFLWLGRVTGCIARVCLYSFQWVSTSFLLLFFFGFFPFSFYPALLNNLKTLAVSGNCYLSLFYFYKAFLLDWWIGSAFLGTFFTYFGGGFHGFCSFDFVYRKTCRKWVSYPESFSQHVRVCVFAALLWGQDLGNLLSVTKNCLQRSFLNPSWASYIFYSVFWLCSVFCNFDGLVTDQETYDAFLASVWV